MQSVLGQAYARLWERLSKAQKLAYSRLFVGHIIILFLDIIGLYVLFVLVQHVVDIERYKAFVELNLSQFSDVLLAPAGPWALGVVMLIKSGLTYWVQKGLWHGTYDLAAELSDVTYYDTFNNRVAGLSAQLNRVKSVTDILPNLLLYPMMLLIAEVLILLFFLVAILMLQPVVAAIMTGFLVAPLVMSILMGQVKLKQIGKQIDQNNHAQQESIVQAFKGKPEIKLFDRVSAYRKQFKDVRNTTYAGRFKAQMWSSVIPQRTFETLTILAIVVLIFATQHYGGIWPLSHYVAVYVAIAFRALPSLNRIVSSANLIQTYHPIILYIPTPISVENDGEVEYVAKEWEALKINDVYFGYQGNSIASLSGLSYTVNKESFLVVTGQSGVGKTSLLELVCGLRVPNKGNVSVDDVPIADSRNWNGQLGYLRQAPFLFNGSIKDNILFGEPNDADRLNNLLHDMQLASWVNELPNGIDTAIGDAGSLVSGGQAQRIALARMLYREPSILLLDEPTNALDSESKEAIWSVLLNYHQKGNTIICVTHDTSLLNMASETLELCD